MKGQFLNTVRCNLDRRKGREGNGREGKGREIMEGEGG